MIGVLKRCGRSVNIDAMIKVYNVFSAPCLDYYSFTQNVSRPLGTLHTKNALGTTLMPALQSPLSQNLASVRFNKLPQHAAVLLCSMHVNEDILYFDYNATPPLQICTSSDNINKLRTSNGNVELMTTVFRPLRPRYRIICLMTLQMS